MSDTTEPRFSDGAEKTVTDTRGRVLVVRQLDLMEEMNLISAAGADDAANRRWMMYATMVACVRAIDGVPVPFPVRRSHLNSNVQMVAAEGVAVVATLLAAETPDDTEDGADPARDPVADTAKN